MHLSPQTVKNFQHTILSWYAQHQRDLPWRKTRDPYRILVSEIMLQQTQVQRVIPKYEAWFTMFPTLQELAKASVSEVLRAWSGLGYNRRALNLQKTAQVILRDYDGVFPRSLDALQKLPGIGKYTSAAIACFAFDEQVPVVDTNIRKVILVEILNGTKETKETTEKEIEEIAWKILPKGRAYEWNQALMDYSSIVLKDKKIPVARQSHFLSSDRYYRGQTIKVLLEVQQISFSGLWDYFEERNPLEQARLESILEGMEKDGLIVRTTQTISLPGV